MIPPSNKHYPPIGSVINELKKNLYQVIISVLET